MKPDRHHARILAMQILCQVDVQGAAVFEHPRDSLGEGRVRAATWTHALRIAREGWDHRDHLDRRIARHLERWDLQRLSPVERNLIRVALVELETAEVPPKVVINEAVEIARKFGGADSPRFVNGILDALWKENQELAPCTPERRPAGVDPAPKT